MKKYLNFIILLLLQLIIFYILPMFSYENPMGMVLLMLLLTLFISIGIGFIKQKVKYIYPLIISILFIPSVFIFYNESALIHSLWYFIDSYVGLGIGLIFSKICK